MNHCRILILIHNKELISLLYKECLKSLLNMLGKKGGANDNSKWFTETEIQTA